MGERVEGWIHGLGVDARQGLHVREDRAQLLGEEMEFVVLELEAGELRDPADLGEIDLHRWMIAPFVRLRTPPSR